MFPAQIQHCRHLLNTACNILRPSPAAREAFKNSLLSLLLETGSMNDKEKARSYLTRMLQDTCFVPGEVGPRENSSPVCYANTPGLRPGFEDTTFPDLPGPATMKETGHTNALHPPGLPENAGLKEILQATQYCVWQIITGFQPGLQVDARLDKQVKELVRLLFGFSPEQLTPDGGTHQTW